MFSAPFDCLKAALAHAERIVSFPEARAIVEQCATQLLTTRTVGTEFVDLLSAAGRVLADEIEADRDIPPFHRATRDGFVVLAPDVAQATEAAPVLLYVVGETKAGAPQYSAALKSGEALEIMTGAPVPSGDQHAVVMLEHTARSESELRVRGPVRAGENIVPAGSEAAQGATLLRSGHRLDCAAIAVAAGEGRSYLSVYAKPRIAILSTGDELVEIDAVPKPHQIRNSNSYSLAVQVIAAGGEPLQLPIARDNLSRLRELLAEGLKADLLLISGGVSAGKYDFVEQVLAEFAAEPLFTGALIQPGKPIVFGRVSTPVQHYFFGLPGNPVSTMVTFELFVRPMLDALSGSAPRPLPLVQARLRSEIKTKPGLTRFLPAHLDRSEVETVPWHGSGDIVAVAQANCCVVIPPDRNIFAAGDLIDVLLRG